MWNPTTILTPQPQTQVEYLVLFLFLPHTWLTVVVYIHTVEETRVDTLTNSNLHDSSSGYHRVRVSFSGLPTDYPSLIKNTLLFSGPSVSLSCLMFPEPLTTYMFFPTLSLSVKSTG